MAGLLTVSAQATLYDRGNGMIYDDALDITWLQDANYATIQYAATAGLEGYAGGLMTKFAAQTWSNNLSYGGYDDWRLPSANLITPSGPFCVANDGSCDAGFNNTPARWRSQCARFRKWAHFASRSFGYFVYYAFRDSQSEKGQCWLISAPRR